MVVKNEANHNMSISCKAYEISNQSIHTSWSPKPGVRINDVMKEKCYNIHVRLNRLATDNSICVWDKVKGS